uniref:(California timema) hypothetical protein n=1 Tax=Timema californicum TaxID=61474 RepID=A0A7R9PE19_TIMCA|nr:unnamed protein product [Timema californicum]
MENNFVKTTLNTPNRDSDLDLPVISSLVFYESNAFEHVVAEMDDAVFMNHEDNRKEYVLNETGKVWTGSARKPLVSTLDFRPV